jgi:signal transduction histidine kinase
MVAPHPSGPTSSPPVEPAPRTLEDASEQRLVGITLVLALLNLFAVWTIPFAPVPEDPWERIVASGAQATMGVHAVVYFVVFTLLKLGRPRSARTVLFVSWALAGTGIALLHRPDLGSSAQAAALLVISTAFFAFASTTTLVLERWARARHFLLLYGMCFVGGHLAVARLAYTGEEQALYAFSTSMTAIVFLGMVWALRRMTLDVEESLARAHRHAAHLEHARNVAFVANQTKTRFLTNMSHELRTPLNAILGYVELVREELPDLACALPSPDAIAPIDADLARVHASGSHLLGLINAILDLSRIEAGRMEPVYETVAVPALVSELADQIRPLMDIRQNTLVVRVDEEERFEALRTDPVKLRQILLNLLSNAAKFTDRGQVTLHVKPTDERADAGILFEVADTGRGIPPERLEAIFEPFEQAASDTHIRFGGTGLGLPLARRLAELLGGTVDVESDEGRGSVFRVRLPAA